MRVLITGITGFVGSHLAEFALAQGAKVYGTCRWRSNRENIAHVEDRIELLDCDLGDAHSTRQALESARLERGIRSGISRRVAHQRDQPAASAFSLWGQQGDSRSARLSISPELRYAHRSDPRLQPHRSAPGRGF